MPNFHSVHEARQHIERYGANPASHHRGSYEIAALREMEEEERWESDALAASASAASNALAPFIGAILAAVMLAYIAVSLVLITVTLLAILYWVLTLFYRPRSASLVLSLVLAAGGAISLSAPPEIPLFLFTIEAPELGSSAWNNLGLWLPVAMILLSYPLAYWLNNGLQNIGLRLVQGKSVATIMFVMLLSSTMPVMPALPVLIWIGAYGLPGSAALAEESNITLQSVPGLIEAGWGRVLSSLMLQDNIALLCIVSVMGALIIWSFIQVFLLRRAHEREQLENFRDFLRTDLGNF